MSAAEFTKRQIDNALTVMQSGGPLSHIKFAFSTYENNGGLESFEDFKKAVDDALAAQQPVKQPAAQETEPVDNNTVDLNAGAPVPEDSISEISSNETTATESGAPTQAVGTSKAEPALATPNFKEIALAAVARGETRILPILVGGKNPAIKWAHLPIHDVSPAEWQGLSPKWIEELATAYPNANACTVARADEYLYIDEDKSDEFRAGFEAYAGESFPRTHTTSARENRCQSGWKQTEYSRKMLWNIVQGKTKDQMFSIRFHNLYVLAEGSVHPKGTTYTAVDNSPLMPIPDELVDYVLSLVENVTFERGERVELNEDGTPKTGDWFGSFSLDQPFIHGNIDNQVALFVWYYIKHKSVSDGQQLFEIIAEKFEKNGCFEPDGVTRFNWNREQIRKKCFDKVKTITTGEQDRKAEEDKALAEGAKIGDAALVAAQAIPTDQIVTTPQEWPTVQPNTLLLNQNTGSNSTPLLVGEPRTFNPREYALQDLYGQPYSGWFPLGRISLVSGASGAMKTTFLTQALVAGRDGEIFLGHNPGNMPFLFLFADRGKYDCEETLQRMNLVGKVPYQCINGIPKHLVPKAIADVAATNEYKILVIDGGDLLVPDNNKGESVGEFTTSFQQIAEHYGVGLIVTTGAGKMSPQALKQGAERRSISKGSEVWGRTVGSVFTMNSEHDGTKDTRRLVVQHRNAATEKFLLQVKDGRLVPVNEAEVAEASAQQTLLEWVAARERFTGADIRKKFKWNGDTSTKRLAGLIESGIIKRRERKDKVWYEVPATIKSLKKAVADHEKIRAENTVSLKSPTEPAKPAETESSE